MFLRSDFAYWNNNGFCNKMNRKKVHREVYNEIIYGKRNWFFFGTVPIVGWYFCD